MCVHVNIHTLKLLGLVFRRFFWWVFFGCSGFFLPFLFEAFFFLWFFLFAGLVFLSFSLPMEEKII